MSGLTSYSFTMSTCVVAFWNLNPQLKIVMLLIASFTVRSGFVHSVFSYSLFGFLNRSALDFVFLQLKFPRSFLYYAGNFSYYAGIILYAFQPLLCLKLCQHNWLKPTTGPLYYRICFVHIHALTVATLISFSLLKCYCLASWYGSYT